MSTHFIQVQLQDVCRCGHAKSEHVGDRQCTHYDTLSTNGVIMIGEMLMPTSSIAHMHCDCKEYSE